MTLRNLRQRINTLAEPDKAVLIEDLVLALYRNSDPVKAADGLIDVRQQPDMSALGRVINLLDDHLRIHP